MVGKWRISQTIAVLGMLFASIAFGLIECAKLNPPTPQLLKGIAASELDSHLKKQFPIGTPASLLQQSLLSQGFHLIESWPDTPSIKRAVFEQTGGGLFRPFPATAFVAWKEDGEGNLVWTEMTVVYTGP